jgi:ribosomal protein L7Ae-like RNA K-turn-binding protein
MENKMYSFLGLAAKARKIISGEDACERAVKAQNVKLVIVAKDASDNTKKKFNDKCKYRDVEIRYFGEKILLGRYIGKEIRSVIAVLDESFSKRMTEILDSIDRESGGGFIG